MDPRMLGFELRYQWSQRSTWVVGIVFLLLGVALSRLSLMGDGVPAAAPSSVALNMGLLSLVSVFPFTVFAARTGLRDRECGMRELVGSTPAAGPALRLHVLAGLAGASLLVAALAVVPMLVLPALSAQGAGPGGTLDLGRYAVPFFLVVVPDTLLLAALLLLVARVSGSALAVHLGGIAVFLGYFGLSMLAGSPLIAGASGAGSEPGILAELLDPFCLIPLLEQTRTWTVGQLGSRQVLLERSVLLNRVLWLGVTAGLAGAASWLREPSGRSPPPAEPEDSGATPHPAEGVGLRFASRETTGWRSTLRTLLSSTRIQLTTRIRSRSFAVITILWGVLAALGLEETVGDGPPFFDTPYLPLTELIVPALFSPFRLVGSLIMIFVAGELVWDDRTTGMHHLVDPSPIGNGTRVGSVVLSLAVVSASLVVLLQVPAVGYQLLRGGAPAPELYISLFWVLGVPWLLVGVLALAVQTLVSDRYLGMVVTAILALLWRPVSLNLLDLDLPLLAFGWTPELDYSVFAGFAPYLGAFFGYAAYWALLALLLGLLAAGLWRRGLDGGLRGRIARIRDEARHRTVLPWAGAGAVAFFATGAVLFVSTVDEGSLVSVGQRELWSADYEKRLSDLDRLPLPSLTDAQLTFDLYPEDRRYVVAGGYRLVNETDAPVDSVLVGWDRWITNRQISIRGGRLAKEYRPFNHVLFVMDRPLQPGEATRLGFRMTVEQSSFGAFEPAHVIVGNGSFVRLERKLPWLGYRTSLELDDPHLRREHGLVPERRERSTRADGTPPSKGATFTLTASTSADQRISAPGRLARTWAEGDRRYYRYESSGRVRPRLAIASASWEERTADVDRRTIHLLHHPRHDINVPALRDASRFSLRTLSELYGTMGRTSVTIAEIPSYGSSAAAATSYPGVVFFREHAGYTGDFASLEDGEVDYLYRRTAHELAHQWWGHRLDPDRSVPGAAFLTETLAEYSAALVLQRRFGSEAFRSLMRWEEQRYLESRGRIGGTEPSLSKVTAETDYVAYFKGPIVLNGIAGLIGREELLSTLKRFLAETASRPVGTVSAGALFDRLHEQVPDRRRGLLDRWIRGRSTYDLALEDVEVRDLPDGRHEVIVDLKFDLRGHDGRKLEADPVLVEPVVIELRERRATPEGTGYPSEPAGSTGPAEDVVVRRIVELRPGRQRVRIPVEAEPLRVEVDPDVTRIDVDRADNVWTAPVP